MSDKYIVRRFHNSDANEVSELIIKTLRTTNIKDYSEEYIENDVKIFTPEGVVERASWTHFYVIEDNDIIVGCGAIGSYWGKEDESSLFNIFVLPEYQGKGVGRKIIEALEKDEYFLRAKRVEIPASITACEFYKKMGYKYKNGIDVVDDEQLLRLDTKFYSFAGNLIGYSVNRHIIKAVTIHRDMRTGNIHDHTVFRLLRISCIAVN